MSQEKNSALGVYHTNLRNIGLYSSISVALVTLSDKRILKNETVNNSILILGIVSLIISFILTGELREYSEDNKNISDKLKYIIRMIKYIIIILLIMLFYSSMRRFGIIK
ncbi:MAG: hypothetical protein CL779_03510 [Chloroflexi bacterium]|nr:hypothetical protein [Chloroflexota bacterium]